jgi:hypothetical protein
MVTVRGQGRARPFLMAGPVGEPGVKYLPSRQFSGTFRLFSAILYRVEVSNRMRRAIVLLLIAGSALLAQGPRGGRMGFGGPGMEMAGARSLMRGAAVTGAPFSAVQVTVHQQTLANGNVIQRQEQTNLFRDSQGRVREETTWTGASGQGSRTSVTISDPVAQVVRRLNPQNKTASEMAIRQPAAGTPGARMAGGQGLRQSAANVVKEDLGTQTLDGLTATGTRVTRTIPAGAMGNAQPIQIVRETWVSSDLKVPVMVKTSDPRFGTTTTQLTNIARNEPDASLFQTPAGYTVSQGRGMRMGSTSVQ